MSEPISQNSSSSSAESTVSQYFLVRNIHATNTLAYILTICAFIVGIVLWLFEIKSMAVLAGCVGALFWVPLILNWKKYYTISRIILLLNLNTAIYIFSTSLGRSSETHLWYITSVVIAFAIVSIGERIFLIASLLVPFLALILTWHFQFRNAVLPILVLTPLAIDVLSKIMVFLSSGVTALVVYFVTSKHFFRVQEIARELAKTLAESEQNHRVLQSVIDGFPGIIQVQALDGRYQLVNSKALEQLNRTRERFVGLTTREIVSGKIAEKAEAEFKKVLQTGQMISVTRTVELEGITRVFLINKFPLRDESDAISSVCTIALDISDKIAMEARLRESESKLKFALEGSGLGVWDWDLKKHNFTLSTQFATQFGYPEFIPMIDINEMKTIIHPEDWAATRDSILAHLEGRTVLHRSEARLRDSNGEWKWVLSRGKISELDLDGNPIRMIGVHIPIDHIKKIEEELSATNKNLLEEKKKSEGLLLALDQSAIVAVTDCNGTIKYANDMFCQMSGCSREELIGQDHRIVNSKTHPKEFFADLWNTIAAGKVWKGEITNRKKNGELYWVSSTIVPQKDLEGRIREYIAIHFDITEQKEAQSRLSATANSVPATIALWDNELRLQFANNSLFEWWGIDPHQIRKITLPELLGDILYKKVEPYVKKVLKDQEQTFEQEIFSRKRNALRKVIISYRPNKIGNVIRGFFVYVQDVTELKVAEESARDGQRRALEAVEAKTQFFANMSHEIRTPLNGVLGMADLLIETPLDAEQLKYVSVIHQSGSALLSVVNDVLDFSKIESGKLAFESVDFSLSATVESQLDIVFFKAEQQGISLKSFVDPNLASHDSRIGDPGRLGQVLLNLIGNAIKFTKKGGILVRVLRPESADESLVRFEVQDTGIGVSSEQIGKLFQPFTQGDGSTARKYGGTGLGLSISKQIVELMGGRIGLESKLDVGSTFWFEIPLKFSSKKRRDDSQYERASAPLFKQDAKPKSEIHIIVADDIVPNQILARALLERLGYCVTIATNGKDVLRLLDQGGFDLILMDCQMPEMDGFEATRRIREAEKDTGRHVAIVALTANALKGDDKKCLDAGMDDYLAKPIKKDHLAKMLEKWLGRSKDLQTGNSNPTLNRGKGDSVPALDPTLLAQLKSLDDPGEPSLLRTIGEPFIRDFALRISEIEAALKKGDFDSLRTQAHKMVSTSGTLAALRLSELFKSLENLESFEPKDPAKKILEEIKMEYDKVKAVLEQEF